MLKRTFSVLMLTLLSANVLTLAFKTQPVKASGTIYIRADGSIDPPTTPITTADNVTYNLTDDIYDSVVVERDNIVVNGAGRTVTESGYGSGNGVTLMSSSNVTVTNMTINNFYYGVYLDHSSGSNLSENVMEGNRYNLGVYGSALNDFLQSVDVSNLANGKPVYYFVNRSDLMVSADEYPEVGYLGFVNCVNVTVQGLNLTGNGQGLLLALTNDSKVTGNSITNNQYGVYLYSGSGNSLFGNSITNNQYGAYLHSGSGNVLSSNTLAGNGYGVYLYSGSDSILFGNIVANNEDGIWLDSSINDTLSRNSVTANSYEGVYLYSSSGNTLSGNNVTANSYEGVYLYSSSGNTLSGNNVTANSYEGVYVGSSSGNILSGNDITGNNRYGIWLYYSSDNALFGDNLANNEYGVNLYYSSNNIFYHNNFAANKQQVISASSANVWDNGFASGGNFWSDYTGTDLYSGLYQNESGNDGIGDLPFTIDANNTDRYPLMEPYAAMHDIAATSVVSSKTIVGKEYNLRINITVVDHGDFSETFNVTVYYLNGTFTSGQWDAFWHLGDCNRDGYINDADNEIIAANYGWTGPPDTNPADIAPPYGVVGLSDLVAYALHEGYNIWNYFLPAIDTETIADLVAGNFIDLTCEWNTTGVAYGNYTITMVAYPVTDETNTVDNNCTGSFQVHIGVPGDVSSTTPGVYDGVTNMKDVAYMIVLFNTRPGSSTWDPNADVNGDGVCNLKDVAIAIVYFNVHE